MSFTVWSVLWFGNIVATAYYTTRLLVVVGWCRGKHAGSVGGCRQTRRADVAESQQKSWF